MVNSGRLSVPAVLRDSPLNTPDLDRFDGELVPGAVASDAPVRVNGRDGWFLQQMGSVFTGVLFNSSSESIESLRALDIRPIHVVPAGSSVPKQGDVDVVEDVEGLLARRFDAKPGTFYLLRPDQHVAMRARSFDLEAVREALLRATCALPVETRMREA